MYFGGGARGCIAEAKNSGVALARYPKRRGVGLSRRTHRENIQVRLRGSLMLLRRRHDVALELDVDARGLAVLLGHVFS